jgi:hypothetical protein
MLLSTELQGSGCKNVTRNPCNILGGKYRKTLEFRYLEINKKETKRFPQKTSLIHITWILTIKLLMDSNLRWI